MGTWDTLRAQAKAKKLEDYSVLTESSYQMRVAPIVIGDTAHGKVDNLLCYPLCVDNMVHLQAPIHHTKDEYTSPLGTRNDWIEIPAWCECGERMNLILGQHKGETQMSWVIMPKNVLTWAPYMFAE